MPVSSSTINPLPSSPGWLSLTRPWKKGDTIDLKLPMHLNTQPINDDPNCVAYTFGPHVLVGCVDDPAVVHISEKKSGRIGWSRKATWSSTRRIANRSNSNPYAM